MLAGLVSLALMTVDHRYNHLDATRATLDLAVYPVQYLIDLPVRLGYWASDTLATRKQLVAENEQLRERQLFYNAQLQRLAALRKENERLRELLKSSARFEPERLLVAELLSVDLDPYKQQVVLNRGAKDGVFVGQPVLDAYGIMGQIIRVNALSATALLISDPSHALPVQINRNGLRSLASGAGSAERLNLLHIPASADVREGDVVSTSGLGGVYPPDYPVAEVTEVHRQAGHPFATVQAKPFARLDRNRNVLLIGRSQNNEESVSRPPSENSAAHSAAAPL